MESFSVSHFELVCIEEMFTDVEGLGGKGLWEIFWNNQEALSC